MLYGLFGGASRLVLLGMALLMAAGCSAKKADTATKSSATVGEAAPGKTSTEPGAPSAETRAATPFTGFAPEGTGQPTEFQSNRPAVLHFAETSREVPGTMWFPGDGADTPFTFSMRHDGSGTYDFVFGPGQAPCRVTDAAGREMAVVDVKISVEPQDEKRTRTIFRLSLAKP